MKPGKSVLCPVAAALTVLLTLQPAWAVRIVREPPPGQASGARPAFAEPRGTIDLINLGSNTMVVDGVAYLYAGASVIVHSSDPAENGNPLKLRKGERIRFTAKREAGSMRERITEIWVLENKASAPRTK